MLEAPFDEVGLPPDSVRLRLRGFEEVKKESGIDDLLLRRPALQCAITCTKNCCVGAYLDLIL